jgi:hypothetical protein
MPFTFLPLDNQYPATWDDTGKTRLDSPPVLDVDTAVRYTLGQDWQNYFTRQRTEGDLFHRDLVAYQAISKILNYLGTRAGLVYNVPVTVLRPSKHLVIAPLGNTLTSVEDFTGFYVVAAMARKKVDSGNCGLRLKVSGGATLYTASTDTTIFEVADISTRGSEITGSDIEAQLYNDHVSVTAEVGGFIAIAPKVV